MRTTTRCVRRRARAVTRDSQSAQVNKVCTDQVTGNVPIVPVPPPYSFATNRYISTTGYYGADAGYANTLVRADRLRTRSWRRISTRPVYECHPVWPDSVGDRLGPARPPDVEREGAGRVEQRHAALEH